MSDSGSSRRDIMWRLQNLGTRTLSGSAAERETERETEREKYVEEGRERKRETEREREWVSERDRKWESYPVAFAEFGESAALCLVRL